MTRCSSCRACWLLPLLLMASSYAGAQAAESSGISLPTVLRLQGPGWWPTKGTASRDEFAGPSSCTLCHFAKVSSFKNAAMSHASIAPSESPALREHDHLPFSIGDYRYELLTAADKSTLKVSQGQKSISADLDWAFGIGHMGQTYLYRKDGQFYETHVSFFIKRQALEITPGQDRGVPKTLDEALGRPQEPSEIQRCFGCHTTASTSGGKFEPEHAFWGVTCEACHGPGAKHIAAMTSGDESGKQLIFNPGKLDPVTSVDFCGACHRTWQDVVGNNLIGAGMLNVRFAPYRLENSRCWQQQDARITCTACHDPHQPLVQDDTAYDGRCFACHRHRGEAKSAKLPGKACPVATSRCVSCHMPKYDPPTLHSSFTDHWIRVVKRGAPYPD
jgi:cytochrome c554/c'-like protein